MGCDERIRHVLAALKDVADRDSGGISEADAGAIIGEAWDELSNVVTATGNDAAVELLAVMRAAAAVDAGLEWHAAVTHQLGDVLTRLDMLPCSTDTVVEAAPRLLADLGFDRAIISTVDDGIWVTKLTYVDDDPQWAELITRTGQDDPQPLSAGLFETEMARRRKPMSVNDAPAQTRVHRSLVEVTQTRSYVAAPIVSHGQVIGLLHADRYMQGRNVNGADIELIASFAHALRLTLSRAALMERLESICAAMKAASGAVVDILSDPLSLSSDASTIDRTAVHRPAARRSAGRAIAGANAVLTARENEVLWLMSRGHTNGAIARELYIAEGTVKQHVKHILRKLRAENRAEAVARLFESDWS